jgi:hypothetical protein
MNAREYRDPLGKLGAGSSLGVLLGQGSVAAG